MDTTVTLHHQSKLRTEVWQRVYWLHQGYKFIILIQEKNGKIKYNKVFNEYIIIIKIQSTKGTLFAL